MNNQLPSVRNLLGESWSQFKETWNESTKVSMWLLYLSLVSFGLALIEKLAPGIRDWFFLIDIAVAVVGIWVGIRITQAMLDIDAGKKLDLSTEAQKGAWKFFWPLIWVGLLQGIITLGGFILLVLPGIYLAVALSFTQFYLLTENKRGLAALAASRALVKGRWWATWWRVFAGNIVLGLGIALLIGIAMVAVGLVTGPTNFIASLRDPAMADPLINGIQGLVQGMASAAFMPLTVLYSVKLFRALEKTR